MVRISHSTQPNAPYEIPSANLNCPMELIDLLSGSRLVGCVGRIFDEIIKGEVSKKHVFVAVLWGRSFAQFCANFKFLIFLGTEIPDQAPPHSHITRSGI